MNNDFNESVLTLDISSNIAELRLLNQAVILLVLPNLPHYICVIIAEAFDEHVIVRNYYQLEILLRPS